VVSNVSFSQRAGTKLVDIYYDLVGSWPVPTVGLTVSVDGGATYTVPVSSISGDVGAGIGSGTGRHIVWDAGADWNAQRSDQVKMRVTAWDPAFAHIPAGIFAMGRTSGDTDTNAPSAAVTVSGFYMQQTETTKVQWDQVQRWGLSRGYTDLSTGPGKAANHPVNTVYWWEVVKWCNARSEMEGLETVYSVETLDQSTFELTTVVYRTGEPPQTNIHGNPLKDGYRLPEEAEWEWAARGGVRTQGYTYSGGNVASEVGWLGENSEGSVVDLNFGKGTWPVGGKLANELGLYDLSGNVWEWCWNVGAESERRLRGGSWNSVQDPLLVSNREVSQSPSNRLFEFGFRVARSQVNMVAVRGGTLPVGSELAGQAVEDFLIGKYEVTWGEWKAVREWAVVNGYVDLAGVGGTVPENGGDSLPVVNMSWYDVVKWCNARSEKEGRTAVYQANGGVYRSGEFGPEGSEAVTVKSGANGYRLPVEKEWEWAARGGVSSEGYTYSGGNVVGEVAWTGENSPDGAKAVGGKKANELGLSDMSGNVWEWVWDLYDGTSDRRIRGGGWLNGADYAEVSNRVNYDIPGYRHINLGFRVAFSSGQ
jgi:formylglycine-generating enzyme required for sulfatase activity